jgi:hypothetical protein
MLSPLLEPPQGEEVAGNFATSKKQELKKLIAQLD